MLRSQRAEPRTIQSLRSVSEVSEALECYRESEPPLHYRDDGKPEGIVSELADIVIRVLDLCEHMGYPLVEAMSRKADYNDGRPYRHGGKVL